jgi:hypothetical protein
VAEQLECRIVVIHDRLACTFELGMFDPMTTRYAPLGKHPMYPVREREKIIDGLKRRIEAEGHYLTWCVRSK